MLATVGDKPAIEAEARVFAGRGGGGVGIRGMRAPEASRAL
jgi:hypothetical protein